MSRLASLLAFAALVACLPTPALAAPHAPSVLAWPSSTAADDPESPFGALDRLFASWRQGAVAPPPSNGLSNDGSRLDLAAMGDADGDGRGDLIATRTSEGPDKDESGDPKRHVQIQILSGADLSKVLWSVPGGPGYVSLGPDVDGDGVQELERSTGTSSGDGSSTPVGPADRSTTSYAWTSVVSYLGGKDGRPLLQTDGQDRYQSTATRADSPAGGGVSSYDRGRLSDGTVPVAPSALIRMVTVENSTSVRGSAVAGGAELETGARTMTLSALGLDGQNHGSAVFSGPLAEPLGAMPARLDGDAVPDLVVLALRAHRDAYPYAPVPLPLPLPGGSGTPSIVLPELHALSGTDMHALWTVQRDAVAYAMPPFGIGDMDGDGKGDLGYAEVKSDPATPEQWSETLFILSGADGSVLASKAAAQDPGVYVEGLFPFGDVNGDGKAEALQLAFSMEARQLLLTLVGLDLAPKWEAKLGLDEEPLDFAEDPYTGMPFGFNDWTGDGFPDIAVGNGRGYYGGQATSNHTLRVLDGATGKDAWNVDIPDVLASLVVPDAFGKGTRDVVVVRAEGRPQDIASRAHRNVTFRLQLLDGADGTVVLDQVLRDPKARALTGNATYATFGLRSLGDLDGDGHGDFGAEVEEGTRLPAREFEDFAQPPSTSAPAPVSRPIAPGYSDGGWNGKPLQTWYLFSGAGKTVSTVKSSEDLGAPGGPAPGGAPLATSAPGGDLPDPAALPGNPGDKDSAGLGILALAPALGLVAAILRRRRP